MAQEEERIKEVREVSEADRMKQVQLLQAQAEAEERKVKEITAAEAEEKAAQFKANQITVLAQAELEAAAKTSEGKKKLAEGTQAEQAASGLAAAKVQSVRADAVEREGLAEARIIAAKGQSEAAAEREKGLAEAEIIAAKGDSEAKARRDVGMAEAAVTREQFKAEADGLVDKFEAMGTMSPQAREHEEFRMSLETALKEALASIEAGKEIARENADVLSQALQKAHIDIVGGEQHFFDTFAKSLSLGKAVDGLASKSSTVSALINKVMQNKSEKTSNDAD